MSINVYMYMHIYVYVSVNINICIYVHAHSLNSQSSECGTFRTVKASFWPQRSDKKPFKRFKLFFFTRKWPN